LTFRWQGVVVRILMSKSGFEDEVLIKLIVGVVKHHATIDELGPVVVDYRPRQQSIVEDFRRVFLSLLHGLGDIFVVLDVA
jgi:hypothetical protein